MHRRMTQVVHVDLSNQPIDEPTAAALAATGQAPPRRYVESASAGS